MANAKKAPAKKTPAKKTTAKKAPAKKAPAKKAPAKKAPAKKVAAKKTPAKKATAKYGRGRPKKGEVRPPKEKKITATKAIRAKCNECIGGEPGHIKYKAIEECHLTDCPLFPFRFGRRPETMKKLGKVV